MPELGVVFEGHIHTSRLKLRLLSGEKCHLILVILLRKLVIMTVIMILCIWHKQHKSSKIRNVQPSLFGTFSEESLQNAVPQSLFALVRRYVPT